MDESYPSPSESVVGFDKIFHPVDAVELELEGSIAPPILGTRRINKRRLNISPEEYGKGEDLGVGGLSVEDEATVPDMLFSEATYQYCGFAPAVAAELWSRFQANRDELPESDDPNHRGYFLSFAFARIDRVAPPSCFDDQQWKTALQEMGLNKTTQHKIKLKEFADIRRTESAAFWAKDTVDNRLFALEDIRRASWERFKQKDRRRQRAEQEERPSI
jgi:hypothetical protein